jgi:hypothetical protein
VKLTNKSNLPESIMNVLRRPEYSKGKAHLSVTQLLNAPKIVALTQKHWNDLEQDAADMVWSLFGTAIHKVLEHGKDENHVVEQRLHAEIDGWKISGAIDLQIVNENGVDIRDYKTTSAWAVMNEKIEWEHQLNMYAYLVERVKKVPVTSVGIVAIIRDWSRRDAAHKEDYPQAPIKEVPIKLWSFEEREAFVIDRVHKHAETDFAMETDQSLPECTPQEMWEKSTSWAVKKDGGVRAKSVHQSEAEALAALESLGKGYLIEVRPGSRTRCENFCPVNQYCQQYKTYMESK